MCSWRRLKWQFEPAFSNNMIIVKNNLISRDIKGEIAKPAGSNFGMLSSFFQITGSLDQDEKAARVKRLRWRLFFCRAVKRVGALFWRNDIITKNTWVSYVPAHFTQRNCINLRDFSDTSRIPVVRFTK
jgi:hypothetical protein